ncbi:MAG: thrombospondin type 3 repeat-containing protein [Myxococcales bacterium]|nr:thrombospondin type 3 repeat-containing protein [Myxococcales bacterium]
MDARNRLSPAWIVALTLGFVLGLVLAGCQAQQEPEFVNILVPGKPVPDCNFDGNDPAECVARCDQMDSDKDGIRDVRDPDVDGDGLMNGEDNCPLAPNADQADADGDGAGDACDNCPAEANPGQEDGNFDGIGDACEDGGFAIAGLVRNFRGPLAWALVLAAPMLHAARLRRRLRLERR